MVNASPLSTRYETNSNDNWKLSFVVRRGSSHYLSRPYSLSHNFFWCDEPRRTTNDNFPFQKTNVLRFSSLGFCIFEFVSYFVLRISYFLFLARLVPAMPAHGSWLMV